MDGDRSSFGALLREARLANGLSQEMLAELARVSTEAVSALERGRRKTPQRETLDMLLNALRPHDALRARLKAAAVRPTGPSRRGGAAPGRTNFGSAGLGNLPRPLTAFFGRATELETLRAMAERHRLITIAGAGGVGKTRTALELAFGLSDRIADGAWFVDLGPLRDSALVAKAIAAALGIHEERGSPLLDVIAAAVGRKQLLLILDNCEHLIDAAAMAAHAILTRCPQALIVAASREALRIDGEAIYRLNALDMPNDAVDITPDAALASSAVALFVERCRARNLDFELTAKNARHAVEICRRLDGIPFALELAAAKTNVLTLAQIAGRLNARLTLLTDGARMAVPRHQTLRALIEWSFDLLGSEEQELFCRLAVFAGGWSVAAAEAVSADGSIAAEDVIGILLSLTEKSLVVVDPASPDLLRFRLLETTREYAAAKLRAAGKFDAVMGLHVDSVLAFARRAQSLLDNEADSSWLEMVQGELENVRTALEWTLRDRRDVAAGAEIAAMLGFFWDSRSHHEGTRWLHAAREVFADIEPRLRALVLLELVRVEPSSSETHAFAKESLDTYRAVDDVMGVVTALEYLGRVLINLGRFEEAVVTLDEGALNARRLGDAAPLLRMLALLAFAHFYGGDVVAARSRLSEADTLIAAKTRIGDHALILKLHAEIALASGDVARAVLVAEQNLHMLERVGDSRRVGIAHLVLAQSLSAAARLTEARTHATAAVRILSSSQIPLALLEAYIVLASACERLADDERAARLVGFARRRAAVLGFALPFLVRRLLEICEESLVERLGSAAFERLAERGAAYDEAAALTELDEDCPVESANPRTRA